MTRLSAIVNFTLPDDSIGSLFVGATDQICEAEAGIWTALSLAREQNGSNISIAFINDAGRCLHRVRLRQKPAAETV